MENEDLIIPQGGRGYETEIPPHVDSPTWVLDNAWDEFKTIAIRSLNAYMSYCERNNLPHSYLLGLDILVTGVSDPEGKKIVDIRPTILEGPCCNSYPACPNIFGNRLYKRLIKDGVNPDTVEYPTSPLKILEKLVRTFRDIWRSKGHDSDPIVAIFTRPYAESEEETAHNTTQKAFEDAGIEIYRITPTENPTVKDGKIHIKGKPVDMCYRRIERIHVPLFYGEKLGRQIIEETPDTIWINPWKIDDLRSKTKEETAFKEWEESGGETISRPITLLADEINPDSVKELFDTGGYAFKKWNSTGGKGVFLHINYELVKNIYDKLYKRYDGRNMVFVKGSEVSKYLKEFENFTEDVAIQQLRIIDSREISPEKSLVYDTRINVIYNELKKEWEFLSGISRVVPCGPNIANGNSMLTNISSGAEIAPLIMGKTKEENENVSFGPLMSALVKGEKEWESVISNRGSRE